MSVRRLKLNILLQVGFFVLSAQSGAVQLLEKAVILVYYSFLIQCNHSAKGPLFPKGLHFVNCQCIAPAILSTESLTSSPDLPN